VLFYYFFLSFPWNCKGFSRTFLVFDVYLVVVVGTPKVEPTRVMNYLCIFNHNTILSLLDMETFSSWYLDLIIKRILKGIERKVMGACSSMQLEGPHGVSMSMG